MESKELLGSRELWGYENFELTDRRTARVNVASGNLHLSERDLAIGGTAGHDAAVTRGYNSQFGSRTEAGRSWMLLPGNFTGLWILTESVVLRADGHVVFTREQGASTFRSPTGFDADLVKNTGGSYTLTFRRSDETWQYNSAGLLTSRQDRFGNTITYTYDLLSGELASMTDTQSRVTNFTWSTVNGARMITRVTGPGGRTYDYGYTTDYLLEIYTDPAANVTDYDYDASKRVIRVTDPEGNKTKFAYDSNDRVTSLTRVDDAVNDTGPTWTFDYTVAWKTVVTDPRSNTTTYHFDRHGRVTKVVDALGNERSSEYHSSSQVESYTDRTSGTPVTNSYTTDGLDNLASTELPTGATTEFAYTDTNNPYGPSEISSTGGATRQISYDTDGALATITDAQTACSGGCKVSLTRNGDGTIATVTDPRGHVTSYGYTSGNRTSIDPPAPQGDTTITYDALSRVDTVTYPNATTVDFGYDAFDRVTSATYGDATSVTYLYDDAGNRTSRVDPTGTTTTLYDELNRITGETFPGSRTTSYVYDDAGNLTSMTDPAGTVSYSYDAVNQVNLMTEPGSAVTDFDFDVAGNLDDITYPNSVVVDYQHDDSNRIKKIAATNGLSTVLAERVYTYNVGIDDTLLRRTVTDENGEVTTYGYDSTDRLTSAVTRGASSNLLDDVGFDYDPSGNLLERDDDGTREWFGYDAANQLTDTMAELGDVLLVVGDPAALTSGDTAVKNRLTGLGATVTTRDDHSSEATSGYDLVVIAESIVSNAVASKYDEDATMAVVNMEDSAWDDHGLATASGTPYTPTQLDIADTVHVGAAGPAGDLAGTTITHTSAGTTEVATAAQIGGDAHVIAERPSSTDAAAFTYQAGATLANAATAGARRVALGYEDDAYTSLSSDGWIVFDNLVRWASGVGYHHDTAGNLTGSDGGLDLGYDAGNDTDSLTALDGTGTLAASYAGEGQFERATLGTTTYTSSILGVTAATTGAATVGYGRDPAAGTVRTIRDGTDEGYLIADAQGSVIAVTDDTGAVVNRYDYTPYGRTTETTLTGAIDNPWRYTGQQQDATGLYKLGIRYYSPDLTRFTQTDPAYPAEALPYGNEYLYTAANPVTYTDPTGAHLSGYVTSCATSAAIGALIAIPTGGSSLVAAAWGCLEGVVTETVFDALGLEGRARLEADVFVNLWSVFYQIL